MVAPASIRTMLVRPSSPTPKIRCPPGAVRGYRSPGGRNEFLSMQGRPAQTQNGNEGDSSHQSPEGHNGSVAVVPKRMR